jgi:hypothetical protein
MTAASNVPSWSTSSLFSELQERPGYSQASVEQEIQTASLSALVTPQPCEHTIAFTFVLNQFNKLIEALNSPGKTIEGPIQTSKEIFEDSKNPIHCFCGRSIHKISLVSHQHLQHRPNDPKQVASHVIMDELAHQKVALQLHHIQQLLDHLTNTKQMTPENFRQSIESYTSLFTQFSLQTLDVEAAIEEQHLLDLEAPTDPVSESTDDDESASTDSINPDLEPEEMNEADVVHPCDIPICGPNFLLTVTPKMIAAAFICLLIISALYVTIGVSIYASHHPRFLQ